MANVAIVYFSAQGHTHQVAEAVAEGVKKAPGATATLLRIVGEDITQGRWKNDAILAALDSADAIVFGTPTYMGNISAQFKAFIDGAGGVWFQLGWKNKLAAGFTHSQGLSGDKLNTLQSLVTFALQHGMLWIGPGIMPGGYESHHVNRLSTFTGVMAQSTMEATQVPAGDLEFAQILGQRVAEFAAKLK